MAIPLSQSVPTQEFFESRQSAAVLKHAILERYLPPYVAKTGSTSPGRRVTIIDGYAGAGRYGDGAAGSPVLFAGLRSLPQLQGREIACYFVEQDPATFAELCQTLTEIDADGWQAWQGSIEEHLDELLDKSAGSPLFLFLDPYGHGLTFDQIVAALTRRTLTPATEALIRIDARAVFRTRGAAARVDPYPGQAGTIARLDATAGGGWWREPASGYDDPTLGTEEFLEWFTEQLLDRLCQTSGFFGWSIDIRHQAHHLPAYYLIFLTRHVDGITVFNQTLSTAQAAWRRRVYELANGDTLLSASIEEDFRAAEAALEGQWAVELHTNILALLADRPRFRVLDHLTEVFGSTLGLARETHLRKVLKQLHTDGAIATDSKGDLYSKWVERSPHHTLPPGTA